MSGIPVDRQHVVGQLASFISLPLERHCPLVFQCADLQTSIALENQVNKASPICPISLTVLGNKLLTEEFIRAVEDFLGPKRLFKYNSHIAQFHIKGASLVADSSPEENRLPSQLFLVSSFEDIEIIKESRSTLAGLQGLPPVFVQVNFSEEEGVEDEDLHISVNFG